MIVNFVRLRLLQATVKNEPVVNLLMTYFHQVTVILTETKRITTKSKRTLQYPNLSSANRAILHFVKAMPKGGSRFEYRKEEFKEKLNDQESLV